MSSRGLCVPLVLASCTANLSLPPAPTAIPVIESVEPESAFAGQTIVLHGRDLGRTAADATVGFGPTVSVRPDEAAPDGTRLRVTVPDAAYGAADVDLTVTNSAGSVRHVRPLRYRGGDRLRMMMLAFVRPLSDRCLQVAALPQPDAAFVLLHRRVAEVGGPVVVEELRPRTPQDDGAPPALASGSDARSAVEAIATSADASRVAVLSGPSQDCPGDMRTFDWLDGASLARGLPTPPTGTRCLSSAAQGAHLSVAPDGTAAVVAANADAWIIPATEQSDSVHIVVRPDGAFSDGVAIEGGEALFAVADGDTTELVRADAAGATSATLPDDWDPGGGFIDRLAAGPSGVVAVLAGSGLSIVDLVDPAARPPRFLDAAHGVRWTRMAVAADGRSLALLSPEAGLVEFFDLTSASDASAARQQVAHATDLAPTPGGDFLVAADREILRVSPRTGAVLSSQSFKAWPTGLAWPAAQAADGDDLVFGGIRRGALGRFASTPPYDLATTDLPLWSPIPADRPTMLVHSADGHVHATGASELWVAHDGSAAWQVLESGDPFLPVGALGLSPDGKVLVAAGGPDGTQVRIWDVPDDGTPLQRLAFSPEGTWNSIDELRLWPGGRGLVSDGQARLLFDWDSRAADDPRGATFDAGDYFPVSFQLPDSYVYVGAGNVLHCAELATGATAACGSLPAAMPTTRVTAASPGGTRLYWLVGWRLLCVDFDPAARRVGRLEPPLLLPVTVQISEIAVAPDGEGLALADEAGDSILIVR